MCKQFIYFFCFLQALCITSASMADLVAYYPFDEGSGNIATDVSGNGHDGTSTGLVWIDGPPGFGKAIYFDGTNPAANYVNCGTWDPSGSTGQLTVALWVRWDGPVTGVAQGIIAKRRTYASQAIKWQLQLDADSPYDLHARNYEGEDVGRDDLVIPQGEWTFIVLTCDSTTGIIYINGVQAASANYSMAYGDSEQIEIGADNAGGANGWNGGIDDVRIYDKVLSASEIMALYTGIEEQATNPEPENEEPDAYHKTSLSWTPGDNADTHIVFLGTNFDDVNNATLDEPLGTEISQALPLDSNNYTPVMALDFGKTYYWRVDEVNAPDNPGTIKGNIWSFTVEPFSIQLPAESITATANNGDPNKTIDGSGLDPENPDQHNSSGVAMWVTNGNDPNGTWIRYDFDKLYKLDQMYVWNYNAAFNNKYGIQDVLIQYSADNGQTWTDITSVTQFAKAPAKSGYTYNTVVPFDGAAANSVRITELSTYVSGSGTGSKAGLSEVRFYYLPVRARKPSPTTGSTGLSVTDTTLSWRAGRDGITHRVYIDTNENAVINSTSTAHTVTDSSYMPSSLNLGRTYYWCVNEINTNETPSVWQSDIWDFSTEEYLTIDDFEDYNDNQFQGYAIFNTWGDGYDTPTTNGGRVGYQDKTPFCETVIVEHGNQSAPIIYDNTGSIVNSEVYRSYSSLQDWSAFGADTLRLYYRGKAVTFQQTSDGLIAMSGEGTDIYGTSDQFRFAYKTLSGDGYIIARVDTIERVNDWSKAGIMIRNSLDPNAIHVTAVLGANGTAEMESRTTKGGTTTTTDVTGQGNPCWLKLTRTGSVINVQRSKDGVNWYSFGTDPNIASTVTVTMSNQVYIGLVVTSHTADTLAAATFSNVSMSSKITGTWTVAAIGDTDQAEGGNTLDSLYVSLTDNANHSKKVFAPSDALGTGSWVQWEIPLSQFSGVTLSKINKIAIGAGDSSASLKGKGTFYIDNIGFGHTLTK